MLKTGCAGHEHLGGISGRLIGGFVGDWLGWAQAFGVMAIISLVCLVLFAWLLPESRRFQKAALRPGRMVTDLFDHLRNPLLLPAYLFSGLNFFIFINQYSYATFLLAEAPYHLPPSWLGLLFLTYLSGTTISAFSGRLAGWLPQPLAMALGVLLLFLGTGLMLMASVVWIITGFLVNAAGFFIAHSNASSWVSQNAHHSRASASSLYLVFYYLGASTGGLYLEPFWQTHGWAGVILGSWLVLLLTFSLAIGLYWRTRSQWSAARTG